MFQNNDSVLFFAKRGLLPKSVENTKCFLSRAKKTLQVNKKIDVCLEVFKKEFDAYKDLYEINLEWIPVESRKSTWSNFGYLEYFYDTHKLCVHMPNKEFFLVKLFGYKKIDICFHELNHVTRNQIEDSYDEAFACFRKKGNRNLIDFFISGRSNIFKLLLVLCLVFLFLGQFYLSSILAIISTLIPFFLGYHRISNLRKRMKELEQILGRYAFIVLATMKEDEVVENAKIFIEKVKKENKSRARLLKEIENDTVIN